MKLDALHCALLALVVLLAIYVARSWVVEENLTSGENVMRTYVEIFGNTNTLVAHNP